MLDPVSFAWNFLSRTDFPVFLICVVDNPLEVCHVETLSAPAAQ